MNDTKWKGRKLLNGMVVNMQHEECITMRFSEGLGIFDKHYGYPEIDDKEIYDGATGNTDSLDKDTSLNDVMVGKLTKIPIPDATGEFTIYFTDNSMEDLWLALTWGK